MTLLTNIRVKRFFEILSRMDSHEDIDTGELEFVLDNRIPVMSLGPGYWTKAARKRNFDRRRKRGAHQRLISRGC